MGREPPLRDELPPEPSQWSQMPLAIGIGWVGLFVVYLVMYLSSGGYPNARAGAGAFVPAAIYLVGAIALALWRPGRAIGSGLLIGLGVWLLVGGGPCVADLARTPGAA
ncbi:hypothetical protein [Sinomonas soli]